MQDGLFVEVVLVVVGGGIGCEVGCWFGAGVRTKAFGLWADRSCGLCCGGKTGGSSGSCRKRVIQYWTGCLGLEHKRYTEGILHGMGERGEIAIVLRSRHWFAGTAQYLLALVTVNSFADTTCTCRQLRRLAVSGRNRQTTCAPIPFAAFGREKG